MATSSLLAVCLVSCGAIDGGPYHVTDVVVTAAPAPRDRANPLHSEPVDSQPLDGAPFDSIAFADSLVLDNLIRRFAPDAKPAGDTFSGALAEGETLDQQILLTPGRCYVVVASGTSFDQLDPRLMVDTPMLSPSILEQGREVGEVQMVGAAQNDCLSDPWSFPVMAKVEVIATKVDVKNERASFHARVFVR